MGQQQHSLILSSDIPSHVSRERQKDKIQKYKRGPLISCKAPHSSLVGRMILIVVNLYKASPAAPINKHPSDTGNDIPDKSQSPWLGEDLIKAKLDQRCRTQTVMLVFVCLSWPISVWAYVCLSGSVYLSGPISVSLAAWACLCLHGCLSVWAYLSLSRCLSVPTFVFLPGPIFVCLSGPISVWAYLCLSPPFSFPLFLLGRFLFDQW